jgi:hypothetical protein
MMACDRIHKRVQSAGKILSRGRELRIKRGCMPNKKVELYPTGP